MNARRVALSFITACQLESLVRTFVYSIDESVPGEAPHLTIPQSPSGCQHSLVCPTEWSPGYLESVCSCRRSRDALTSCCGTGHVATPYRRVNVTMVGKHRDLWHCWGLQLWNTQLCMTLYVCIPFVPSTKNTLASTSPPHLVYCIPAFISLTITSLYTLQ